LSNTWRMLEFTYIHIVIGKRGIDLKKAFFTLIAMVVLLFGSIVLPNTAHADPANLDEVKAERQKLKAKLSDKELEIAEVLDEIEELHNELVRIEEALKANKEQIKKTEKDIDKYEEEIAKIQEEIDLLNIEIEKRSEILKTRISSYQLNGGNINYLEVLLGATDFNDFISRISAVTRITNADADLIEQQERDKALVVSHQKEIESKLEEKEELMLELEAINETISEQKESVEKAKKKLDKKEEKLKKDKAKLKSEDNNLAALEASYRNSMRQYSPSNSSSNSPKVASTETVNMAAVGGGGGGSLSAAISAGKTQIGTPYVWAGKSPGGFDCSGFVSWAYKQAGYNVPSSTGGLAGTGTKVSLGQAKAGDLIFFNTYKTNGHVGIYLGNGNFLAANTTNGVEIKNINDYYWRDTFNGHLRRVN